MLLKGSTFANSLIGVFLRFRIGPYALVGDIRKIYHQCMVNESFQDFLRFLWFLNDFPSAEIIHCRMTRLAYGLICSQSEAQFCLQQTVLRNEIEASSLTVGLANSSFYVLTLYSEIVPLLESGGFYLTKFLTNCPELHAKISCEDYARSSVPIKYAHKDDTSHKALGMRWKSQNDSIVFYST